MDLEVGITNNDNGNSSKTESTFGHCQSQIPSSSSRKQTSRRKSEQYPIESGVLKQRKKLKHENQQGNYSQEDSLNCQILLESNSKAGRSNDDGGGALSPQASDWWVEETLRTRAVGRESVSRTGSKENKERVHLGSGAAGTTKEVDKKRDKLVVTNKRKFKGDEDSPGTTTVASTMSLYHRLARVDPIVDFFTVDEELLGRFRICSCLLPQHFNRNSGSSSSYSCSDEGLQQAIIFKIKTTSPYSFWVRPIYGLMRPNVIAWVEVKCELKGNSLAKLEQSKDEFLVEICPVPGAINLMTNDLYTNCVHSNMPDLLNIWEKVEEELNDNQKQLQGFVKEFFRVSCRFHRSCLSSSMLTSTSMIESARPSQQSALQQTELRPNVADNDKNDIIEAETENNNVKMFQWNPFPSSVEAQQQKIDERYHLAREFPSYQHPNEDDNFISKERCDNHGSSETTICCARHCRASKKLYWLSFILAVLLLASLIFIFYSQYCQYKDKDCNNKAERNLEQIFGGG